MYSLLNIWVISRIGTLGLNLGLFLIIDLRHKLEKGKTNVHALNRILTRDPV
jgi:hypothetical protein